MFFRHVGALFWPGTSPGTFAVHTVEAGNVDGWSEGELHLLIEEGRGQLARQREDLRQIQSRAQWLFSVNVGLLGLLVTVTRALPDEVNIAAWLTGVTLVGLSILGAASIMTVRGEFAIVDAALLSQVVDKRMIQTARAYANGVAVGENTVATRLTVFRDAIFLSLVGGAVTAIAWLWGA